MTGLDAVIRAWFATRLEVMPCDDDIEAHESLQMAAHALLGVLDLHEPHPSMPGDCFRCDSKRPCSTVRVIAEKLGVDHD